MKDDLNRRGHERMTPAEIAEARAEYLALPIDPPRRTRAKVVKPATSRRPAIVRKAVEIRQPGDMNLTSLEVQLMQNMLDGETGGRALCESLGYSRTVAYNYTMRLRLRFGARSMPHLAIILFQCGYIDPAMVVLREPRIIQTLI